MVKRQLACIHYLERFVERSYNRGPLCGLSGEPCSVLAQNLRLPFNLRLGQLRGCDQCVARLFQRQTELVDGLMKLLLLCGSRLLEGGLFGLMLLQNGRKHGRTIGAGGGEGR